MDSLNLENTDIVFNKIKSMICFLIKRFYKNNSKIEVLSISPLMAEAIKRISNSTSVSDLFN